MWIKIIGVILCIYCFLCMLLLGGKKDIANEIIYALAVVLITIFLTR